MFSVQKKTAAENKNLKKYCELSFRMKLIDEQRKEVQESAFIESNLIREKLGLNKDEQLKLIYPGFEATAKVNITSKKYKYPKALIKKIDRLKKLELELKEELEAYTLKKKDSLISSNRSIAVSIKEN